MTIFSVNIIPLLTKYDIILPIVQPSERFMKEIIQKINNKNIISLHLTGNNLRSTMHLASSVTFVNVKSLSINNFQRANDLNELITYFPKLQRLCLYFDNEIDLHNICRLFNQIQIPIKQLEIHCGYILCSHYRTDLVFSKINKFNCTVEFFSLHVRNLVIPKNLCKQNYDTCFLRTTTDFVKTMLNIRDIRFIINKGNVMKLLDATEWTSLEVCHNLKKVTIKMIEKTSSDTQLKERILKAQNDLLNARQTIQLDVICE